MESILEGGERIFLLSLVGLLLVGVLLIFANIDKDEYRGISYPTSELSLIDEPDLSPEPVNIRSIIKSAGSKKGYAATHQPDEPFWLTLTPNNWGGPPGAKVVELRMLRASEIRFWKINNNNLEEPVPLLARNDKGGIAIEITTTGNDDITIAGRVTPIGVARPKVFLWDKTAYDQSLLRFERWGGSLLGSFIVLSIFSALVGAINRDWSFFLFSGWLITSLRVASINDGWDLIWLGLTLENETLLRILRFTLAAHGLLTLALFRSLLATELKESPFSHLLKLTSWAFTFLVITSIAIPHRLFLPILWSASALGIAIIIFSLCFVVYRTRSSVSLWYTGSWGLTFAGILTEVAYASGISKIDLSGLNSQTSSIASGIVTAIALAEKLRIERSARLLAQKEKVDALNKFKENYNSMPVGLFSADSAGEINLYNPEFASMFSLPSGTTDVPIRSLLGDSADRLLSSNSGNGDATEIELEIGSPESSNHRWFLARVTSKDNSIEGSIQDITTRKQAENKLKHLVDHDSLTGLLNRRGLEQVLQSAAAAARAGTPCAIAHVDMDRFKLVNDLYGHAIGDGMLHAAASRLMNAIRTTDRVARLADSFIIVFMDCPVHAATRLTERLRETISDHPFELDGKSLNMTVSIGVVALDPEMSSVDSMAAADRACAEAKAHGRNCVVLLNEKDDALRTHLEELKVVAGLQQHVPVERYFLEFQPIVSLRAANQSLNYEVLIRMKGDDGGVVPPGKFIGAAERNGLMSQIDRWVLRSTLEWLDQHPAHRDRLSFATLNISGASLNDARFVDDAFSMIAEHPLAATKLCFEITESIALNDLGSTRRFVDRVRAFGSKLALDDFGAGYTSFNYLKEIPADFIKIDGSFVKDINRNPGNYAITRTIVDLTHELGMSSIAEWAETPDTIASLMELQVDYGQGFGLARPMAKELVTNAISSSSLVRDPSVLTLLAEGNRQMISLHPAGPRRS